MWILFCELVIHGFRSNVFLFEECIQDEFALSGDLQLVLGEVLPQDVHLSHVLAQHNGLRRYSDRPLENEMRLLVKGVMSERIKIFGR